MKEITRTVFYVQRDGEDIKAFKSFANACDFVQEFNGVCDGFNIIEVDIIGHSSYPEMLNAKYDSGDTVHEDAPAKQQGKIEYKYRVQYQTPEMKAGWLTESLTPYLNDACSKARYLENEGIAKETRIISVGHLV